MRKFLMKISNYTGFVVIILFLSGFQMKTSFRQEIYNAFVSNRMERWKGVIDRMSLSENKSNEFVLELVNYQYGYIGYCIRQNLKDEVKLYLKAATANIEKLENNNYKPALTNAYKCAFYGFRIELNGLSAPINGPKSLKYGLLALDLDSNDYFVCLQYGNILFNMPAAFGGSREEGLRYFLKAKKIIESKPSELVENWNYPGLLVTVAQSYTQTGDFLSAKAVYEMILEKEPDFIYVKDELYPDLLKKMTQ